MTSSADHLLAVCGGCGLGQKALVLPIPFTVFQSPKTGDMIELTL